MTDRFEVPEGLVYSAEAIPLGERVVRVADLPALIRAEVERYITLMHGGTRPSDEMYLASRYGPAPAAEAQEPTPGPVFTREAADMLMAYAAERVAYEEDSSEAHTADERTLAACRAYLKSIGRS